jgi:metal-sulfur cluster biosynthetic enzyme
MSPAGETHGDLMRQLAKVPEPCSIAMGNPVNICEMGLIEDVTLVDGTARVVLCLTDPSCINYGRIRQYITDSLMQLEAVRSVEVTHTTDVLWTPDRVRRAPRTQPLRFEPRDSK